MSLREHRSQLTRHFQVGVPYLRAKAQDYYEQLGGGVDADIINQSITARRAAFDQVYSPLGRRACLLIRVIVLDLGRAIT